MNKDTLNAAIREAERFVKIAKDCRNNIVTRRVDEYVFTDWSLKHSGAAKRASMDLTRALADLRRPG